MRNRLLSRYELQLLTDSNLDEVVSIGVGKQTPGLVTGTVTRSSLLYTQLLEISDALVYLHGRESAHMKATYY